MEVRAKDKIFMAAFIPIAAAAAYFYYWRMDAARTLDALDAECAALVAPEDFPFEKRIREARIPEAQKELSDVRALPPPTPSVAADATAPAALRESEVIRVFSDAGLVVLRCETLERREESAAAAALAATGMRSSPICRRWTLDGSYPAVKRALDAFSRERIGAIADGISMRQSGFARWSLDVWM